MFHFQDIHLKSLFFLLLLNWENSSLIQEYNPDNFDSLKLRQFNHNYAWIEAKDWETPKHKINKKILDEQRSTTNWLRSRRPTEDDFTGFISANSRGFLIERDHFFATGIPSKLIFQFYCIQWEEWMLRLVD